MNVEPTRDRVEAYEKAIGCKRVFANGVADRACLRHPIAGLWTDLGCPMAVAAARVEAERVAEIEESR